MDLSEVNEICNRQSKKIAELEKINAELLEVLKECCDEARGFSAPNCYSRIKNGHCADKDVCIVWKAIAKTEGK